MYLYQSAREALRTREAIPSDWPANIALCELHVRRPGKRVAHFGIGIKFASSAAVGIWLRMSQGKGVYSMISPIMLIACTAFVLYYILDNAAARHEGQAPPA